MNHWDFVIAAYALTFATTIGVVLFSLHAMRRAEQALKRLEKDA